VQREIGAIKELLAEQTKTIASQAEQVQNLTAEIEALKAKLG
jgi:coronin-1B/1C/6